MFQTIQSYRGFAAIAVAAFHLSIGLADSRYLGYPILSWLTWKMGIGVDFFFVLSGFIIMLAHEKDIGRPDRLRNFLTKRFVRIYPIYWVYVGGFVALVALGFGTVTQGPSDFAEWFTTFSLIRLENFLLPISPAWTLIHEVAFYAAFACLILNRRIGFAIFIAWQIACLLTLQFPGPDERTPFNVYFATFNLDFSIGMLSYWLYSRKVARVAWAWIAGGVLLFAALIVAESHDMLPVIGPLLYGASFGALILGSAIWEADRPKLKWVVMPFLGEASYSIYLTHNALEGLFMKIAVKMKEFFPFNDLLLYFFVLIATVVGGCAAYLIVERPILALANRRTDRARSPRIAVPAGERN